ncbi:MAG: restriction endonuclease subunit S [Eggerthellaceae bacterium]|nr:restriction endonuclease subunit S [Eggerthellaceae bacterium]
MQRYEAYKDSGVEWIGEIPAGWEVERLKYCLSVNSGGIWGDDPLNDGFDKYVLRSTEQTVGGEWAITDPAIRNMSAVSKLETYRILPGDLVVTKSSGSPNHIGKTTIAGTEFLEREYYYSNFMQRVRLQDENNPRFYWYVMNSDLARNQYVFLQNSTSGLGNLSAETIGLISVPHPRVIEQQAIADYLDVKTAQIDSIVSQTERSIELLREYRKSAISEAVTKGLDPDAPMRDSGVEWIGEIPARWRIAKMTLISKSVLGRMLDQEKDTGRNAHKYLSNKDVQWFAFQINDLKEMGFPEGSHERYRINDGDLMVCEGGEVGRCAVWRGPTPSFYFQKAIHRVRFDSLFAYPEYMAYQMYQKALCNNFAEVRKGESTIAHLPGEQLSGLRMILPPLPEQQAIADYLDGKTAQIDSLIADKQRQVELLKEYRKSLISEAVTGKFKVPGLE